MKSFALAAATTLLSTTYASTVTLETTQCLNNDIPLGQFSIELGTSGPVTKDLPSVCGLRILSASDSVNVRTIQCQAFRDTAGTQPGSAVFTYDHPALIATNPIHEKSIWCSVTTKETSALLNRRQNEENSTSTAEPTRSSTRAPRSTVYRTITASLPETSASGNATDNSTSTTVTTVIASASSGLPTLSGNATVPSNTGRPSATQSQPPAESTGAAATMGMGAGVIVAGLFAMFL